MKRLLFLCSMLSLLVGCNSDVDEMTQPVGSEGATTTESGLPKVITAAVSDFDDADTDKTETRTYAVRDQYIFWQNGDAITYFARNQKAKYVYNGKDGVLSVNLDLAEESNNPRILYTHAVYPHNANTQCVMDYVTNTQQLSVTYPAEQTYKINSFGKGANLMVAVGTTPDGNEKNLNFRNACGYFTIKLYGSKTKTNAIKSIKLTALGGEKIAGPATIVALENGEAITPKITMSDEGTNEVTLNCGNSGVVISQDAEHPTEFWFALPPTTLKGGIRIEVVDVDGTTHIKETTKQITITRNKIQPMAAFKFAYPTDNQLWYTRHSNSTKLLEFYGGENPFDAQISRHYYDPNNKRFIIEFDAPLTVIKETAFKSMGLNDKSKDMASVYLPEKLTTIEEQAFYNSGITDFVFPGSVTFIGPENFVFCRLNSVTFLPSPTNTPLEMEISSSMGDDQGPFFAQTVLNDIYVNRDIFLTDDGELFIPDDENEGIFAGQNISGQTSTVVIGEQVPEIYPYMFALHNIKNIEIPAHISKIGDGAFFGCYGLTSITIPKTVKSIGVNAFLGTTSLHTVTIEDSDEPLQLGMAYDGTVAELDEVGPFYDSPLSNIYLGREIDYRDKDGSFTPSEWGEGVFANWHYDEDELETTLTISNNVKTLSEWMFSGVRMREVTIPASVTEIKHDAFLDCRILNKVTCESTTPATMGEDVFDSCDEFDEGQIRVPASAVNAYKSANNWSDYKSQIVGY